MLCSKNVGAIVSTLHKDDLYVFCNLLCTYWAVFISIVRLVLDYNVVKMFMLLPSKIQNIMTFKIHKYKIFYVVLYLDLAKFIESEAII